MMLPQLVLGIPVDPDSLGKEARYPFRLPKFQPGRDWLKIAHQTGGHACHQHYLVGTILQPKSVEVLQKLTRLQQKWLGTDCGCFGVALDDLYTYRKDLNEMGLDCQSCYRDFEEGFFPVDSVGLPLLTNDVLPKDLDELIDFESGFDRMCGCIGRWHLQLLGENGD